MKLGTNDISAVKIGSTDVNKVYIGSTEVWSSFTGLLDTYTGATAAYSLRQLKSGVTNAIEVRRASDNTTQDIGFVNNELDVTSLESFCSGTNGFVTTWYDQSGNGNDATQSTASDQPQIVSSGSVITENGEPAVQFDGSDDNLYSSTFSQNQPNTIFVILKQTRNDIGGETFLQSTGNTGLLFSFGTTKYAIYTGIALQGDNVNTNQNLHYGLYNGSSSQLQTNNGTVYSGDVSTGVWADLYLGSRNGTSFHSAAKFQEIIIFNGNKSSDKSDIQTNINDFYSIY